MRSLFNSVFWRLGFESIYLECFRLHCEIAPVAEMANMNRSGAALLLPKHVAQLLGPGA